MMSMCFIVESGTDVRLVDGLANRFNLSVLARRIEGGVEISQPPTRPFPIAVGPASKLKFAVHVWRHLRANKQRIDRVLVQGYGLAAFAANLAGRFNRTPTAMLVCSPVEDYYRCRKANREKGKPFLRRELWALSALARMNALIGQRYIVLSRYLSSIVKKHGRRLPVTVIPIYGVDTMIFTPPTESKADVKARLSLPLEGTLIFFSSRVAPEKDAETLLEAFRMLLRRGQDVWLLHRSGGHREFLRAAEEFGVADRVIATDAVHPHRQLPDDYRASDLCVQASREEGLGFSPLEALACGVPVVASAVGGLRETIIDGETGWTYPSGNADALARCIEEALGDNEEAARRAALGREMVRAVYERAHVFERLTKTVEGVVRPPEREAEVSKTGATCCG